MSTCHPQVRQGYECEHLYRVLHQATKPYLGVTKLAFDHAKRMLDLRACLRFGFLDAAVCLVQCTFLAVLFVRAAPSRDLPDDLAPLMLLALLDARIPV